MATVATQPFSLFPRSVPKIATPNPHNRTPSLHIVKPLEHVSVVEEPLPSGGAWAETMDKQAVNIQMKPLPAEYIRSRTPSPESIGMAVSTMSPVDGSTPSPSIAHHPTPRKTTPREKLSASSSPEPASGLSRSATLVQQPRNSMTDPSPVVPIRSMFPTYNPSLPLGQQSYYPQRPFPTRISSMARSNVSRSEYRDSISTPIDRSFGLRSTPASVVNFPTDLMSISEPQFSSHRELEKLWEATHGAEPNRLIKSFTLEMARIEEAVFTFGADPQFPFYTLKTFDTNEIAISKTSPQKRTVVQDIIMSSLEPPARRLPPYDGLVSFIFPKLAAMLALSQSAALAKQHGLASTDKDDVEAAAVRRAAEQEACNLRWNALARRYELDHPAIARGAQDPNFTASPATPLNRGQDTKPVLHITVSSDSLGSPINDDDASPPVIIVRNPTSFSSPTTSPHAGIRLSTLPQSDFDYPLASLDLGTQTLKIDADQILNLMPSLFAIDSIVSAILAVAVADESCNPILGSMPIWMPRPKAPASQFGGSVKSYAGSAFYATFAEREEAEVEAAKAKAEHERDVKIAKKKASYTGKRTWYGGKERQKTQKRQILMGEFDLEKLGHYQAGERQGQELPAVTRGVVGGLIGGLKFIVWLLTLIVQFVCWLLVSMTRVVTSEKF